MAKTQCVLDIMKEKQYIRIENKYFGNWRYTDSIPLKRIWIVANNVPQKTAQDTISFKIQNKIKGDKDYIWNTANSGFYIKHDVEQYVKDFLESGKEKKDISTYMHPWLREWIANNYDGIELERNAFLINTQVREQRLQNEKNKSDDALELLYNIL